MEKKAITVNMTPEDASNLKVVMQDSKIERGASETLRVCIEDAYRLKPDFKEDLKKSKKFDNSDIVLEEAELKPKSFLVDSEIFQGVYKDVKDNLGLLRPRISFVVRLCVCSARVRYEAENNKYILRKDRTDETNEGIPTKGDLMMMVGKLYEDTSAKAKEKIVRIIEVIEKA